MGSAEMRRVSIFGATGSIGQNTIDLIARDPSAYDVVALTGAANVETLAADAKRLKADVAITADETKLDALRDADILVADDTDTLADAYRAYRVRMHLLSLAGESRLAPAAEFAAEREAVSRLWNRYFGDPAEAT